LIGSGEGGVGVGGRREIYKSRARGRRKIKEKNIVVVV
jgi:hypothetical protein